MACNMNKITTNWEALALKMGILKPDGSESYLGQYPYSALEEILGDAWIEHAVDTFINGGKGNELAIKTVRQLRSKKAAEYAFKVFNDHKNTDETKANLAIFAMCDILHPLCMTYVETFLTHEKYANTGLWLMRQLLFDGVIFYDKTHLKTLLKKAKFGNKETIDVIETYINEEMT
jgi:hypothetical protein